MDPSRARRRPAAPSSFGPAEVMLPEMVEVVKGENAIDLVLP